MIVTFGLNLDHRLPYIPKSCIGEVTVGPMGMLSILETQLGLAGKQTSQATRIVQYRGAPEAVGGPKCFYHRSFTTDAIGVARMLLNWRDQWYLAGWDGTIGKEGGAGLKDMVAVEKAAVGNLGLSPGERLRSVLGALKHRCTQIKAVNVVDGLGVFPYMWQQVLIAMGAEIRETFSNKSPSASAKTDLGRLQRYLYKQDDISDHKLSQDKSVIVIRAGSRQTSARLIAEYHRKKSSENFHLAVMAGGFGHLLDECFETIGSPILGISTNSPLRPIPQVLSLVLSLVRQPLSPLVLLQFLTHPVCPIRRRISARLAKTVAEHPGIGGPAWIETIEQAMSDERGKFGVSDERVADIRRDIDFWLNSPWYEPEAGAFVSALIERCAKLMVWLGLLAGVTEDSSSAVLAGSAHSEATEAITALQVLEGQGITRISRRQVEKLIDEVSIFGSAIPDRPAECGHLPFTDSPAAFIEPVDMVFWCDFSEPTLPMSPPWFEEEINALTKQGVHLPAFST
jgi:hypothetical protein